MHSSPELNKMANLSKQDVWNAINNAPPGMVSQEVLDGLIAQGHQLEGYTPHPDSQQLEQNNQPGIVSQGLESVANLGKMAHSGYNMLADKFSDPSSPLYDEAVAGTLRGL